MQLHSLLDSHGKDAVPFNFSGQPERTIVLHTYRAETYRLGKPVVFVQHGMMRNGDAYRDFWIPAADKHGLLIIAPTFSRADFPEVENYNNGMVLNVEGVPISRDGWVYNVPGLVAAALAEHGIMAQVKPRIFGHSAGGQFLHRMVALCGAAPFEAVVAANAGWYSMPTLDAGFPAGLGGLGIDDAALAAPLATPLHIMAGLKDCEANAEHLPMQPEAVAQGPGRLHRARNYYAAGRRKADALGCAFNWQLTEVPGVAHDGRAMSAATAGFWFEGKLPDAEMLGAESGAVNA